MASFAATIFFIMESPGNIPTFHGILGGLPAGAKTRIIAREAAFAFVIPISVRMFLNGLTQYLNTTLKLAQVRPWTA